MKSTTTNRVAIAAIAVGLGLAGCGSEKTETTSSPTTPPAAGPTAPGSGPETPAPGSGPAAPAPSTAPPGTPINRTLAAYVRQNSIVETRLKRGEPGTPEVGLPAPEGWEEVGAELPEYAYSAIIYTGADRSPDYTPNFTAVMSKLTGNVDTPTIIALASGELKNLAGYTPAGEGAQITLAGFPAYQLRGTWNSNGQIKYVAQTTVVMPASDGLYVLQINADGLETESGVLNPATDILNNETTITLP